MSKITWILETIIWFLILSLFCLSIFTLFLHPKTFMIIGSICGFVISLGVSTDRILIYRRIKRKANEFTVWDAIMQSSREHPPERYWTVQEFLEFYEVLKVANLLEIYYDACPDFRRIAIRLYNLFGGRIGGD